MTKLIRTRNDQISGKEGISVVIKAVIGLECLINCALYFMSCVVSNILAIGFIIIIIIFAVQYLIISGLHQRIKCYTFTWLNTDFPIFAVVGLSQYFHPFI